MSSTHTETPPHVRATAILALPSLDGLTEDQVRGFTCVWDSAEEPLTEETAVDLGPRRMRRLDGHYDWHPRSCAKHVSQQALHALFDHCQNKCETCGRREGDGDNICDTGLALLRLHMRTGRL